MFSTNYLCPQLVDNMKKVFVSLLLLCMSIIVYAQSKKSLVTLQMSNRVAYYVKNHRGFSTISKQFVANFQQHKNVMNCFILPVR